MLKMKQKKPSVCLKPRFILQEGRYPCKRQPISSLKVSVSIDTMLNFDVDFLFKKKKIIGNKSFLWGHWYPCLRLLVMSPLGIKARVGSLIRAWQRYTVTRSLSFFDGNSDVIFTITPINGHLPLFTSMTFMLTNHLGVRPQKKFYSTINFDWCHTWMFELKIMEFLAFF